MLARIVDLQNKLRRIYIAIVVLVLSGIVVLAVCIWYTGRTDRLRGEAEREADRRWCALLDTLDDSYRTTPPSTPGGRAVARDIQELRVQLGCAD